MSYDLQLDDGDIVIDNQGDVLVVEGYNKLFQDFIRLIYTARGDNQFDTDEGMGIYELLGKVLPRDIVESVLSKEIYQGLQHMIDQQTSQQLVQSLSPYEQIATIDGVVLTKLRLKQIAFDILITTTRGLQVAFAFNIK